MIRIFIVDRCQTQRCTPLTKVTNDNLLHVYSYNDWNHTSSLLRHAMFWFALLTLIIMHLYVPSPRQNNVRHLHNPEYILFGSIRLREINRTIPVMVGLILLSDCHTSSTTSLRPVANHFYYGFQKPVNVYRWLSTSFRPVGDWLSEQISRREFYLADQPNLAKN